LEVVVSADQGGSWSAFGRSLRDGLLHLLYPGACAICGCSLPPGDAILCDTCLHAVTSYPLPSCPRCAAVVGPFVETEDGCSHCRNPRPHFDAALRLGRYEGPLRELILRMKYGSEWLAEAVGRLWSVRAAEQLRAVKANAVVPVPLHWWRRLTRGYNQSEALAREIAGFLGIPCLSSLLRIRHTRHQSAFESLEAKRENVRNAFRAADTNVLRGRTVLLVDDVMTSCSTASEAARSLKAAGAARVVVAVLARAA
jgi:ComF family protein